MRTSDKDIKNARIGKRVEKGAREQRRDGESVAERD